MKDSNYSTIAPLQQAKTRMTQAQMKANSAQRALSREILLQKVAASDLEGELLRKHRECCDSLSRSGALLGSMNRRGGLWGDVARTVADVDGNEMTEGNVELVKALEESTEICESFTGESGANAELLRKIDRVIGILEQEGGGK